MNVCAGRRVGCHGRLFLQLCVLWEIMPAHADLAGSYQRLHSSLTETRKARSVIPGEGPINDSDAD
jgi:hypothetical protein